MAGRTRPDVCGPAVPEAPYPVYLDGLVEHGFGRGGKKLNTPTANLPLSSQHAVAESTRLAETGIYYGFAQLDVPNGESIYPPVDAKVYPMVMSFGYNPHFANKDKTIEVHVMHGYAADFYGKGMRAIVLGYIRPELKYDSLEALIADIEKDKQVGIASLERPAYTKYIQDPFFRQS
ncbi:riboflavin kinase [Malassezia vespertilionis]|uniref:Riboflavin kinase n=1 Tax=Malassezia vespertilionis TaxID=2020962 RepID=A0A2N1JAP3_9BASI|nr:riboflavin kinase [Malassezia vespertilionis]PKI83603.1 Fmn1p [Malassezia vespertilionis]WFD07466.1 riboflavin kinase [Malassezia vespertilionis]